MCERERERDLERERDRQTDRQTDRERERERLTSDGTAQEPCAKQRVGDRSWTSMYVEPLCDVDV